MDHTQKEEQSLAVEPLGLSDCINWESNSQGDCGGRMMQYRGENICETCFNSNDPAVEASKLLSKEALLEAAKHGQELGTCDEDS